MSCSDLIIWEGTVIIVPAMGAGWHVHLVYLYLNPRTWLYVKIFSYLYGSFCIEDSVNPSSAGLRLYINGLVQERGNSIANALELRLFCPNPWIQDPSLVITVPADVPAPDSARPFAARCWLHLHESKFLWLLVILNACSFDRTSGFRMAEEFSINRMALKLLTPFSQHQKLSY